MKKGFWWLLLLPLALPAAEYVALQPSQSTLTFVSKQMGVPVSGSFTSFKAALQFDPQKSTAAKVQVTVDMASIDVGMDEANKEVKGKNWFDVARFPVATFVADSVRPGEKNRFEVSGRLTIRDKSQPLSLTVTMEEKAGRAIFDGSFPIKRSVYALGAGEWADTSVVADEVRINFHFVVTTK